MTSTKTRVNKIGTVVVPVADQQRAIEFYTEKLGFEKRVDVPFGPEEGYRWVEVGPADAVTTANSIEARTTTIRPIMRAPFRAAAS